MSLLSPVELYHAELRQQLGVVGRALALQRALAWVSRGLVVGSVIDFTLVTWDWTHGTAFSSQTMLLGGLPAALALAAAAAALIVRPSMTEVARRVDRVAALHERALTALELGKQKAEHPLALAQMHDAVEHLRRLDTFRAFAPNLPRRELAAGFALVAASASLALSPNPWLARMRDSMSPAEAVAVDQALKVQRVADSLLDTGSPQGQELRDALNQGARSVQASSSQPDSALQSLQNLQRQIADMSAGDSQLQAGLSAAANALASSPQTKALASAIDSGDPRQTAQALSKLAQQIAQMTPDQQAQLAQALNSAADQARNASASTADQLSAAAQALASPDSAAQALNQLGDSAMAAADRQRAQDQVSSSTSALARALGQVPNASMQRAGQQTRANGQAGQNGQSSSQSAQSGTSNRAAGGDQAAQSDQAGQADQNAQGNQGGSGQGDQNAAGNQGSANQGQNGQSGSSSGYSTGDGMQPQTGDASRVDSNGHIEQVPQNGQAAPDQSGVDPNLSRASNGSASAAAENVSPAYSTAATQGGSSQPVPQGLQDLVRDYFNSAPPPEQSAPPQN